MSDAWNEIQAVKSKRNSLREKLEKRKKERQDILGSSVLLLQTSSPVASSGAGASGGSGCSVIGGTTAGINLLSSASSVKSESNVEDKKPLSGTLDIGNFVLFMAVVAIYIPNFI